MRKKWKRISSFCMIEKNRPRKPTKKKAKEALKLKAEKKRKGAYDNAPDFKMNLKTMEEKQPEEQPPAISDSEDDEVQKVDEN